MWTIPLTLTFWLVKWGGMLCFSVILGEGNLCCPFYLQLLCAKLSKKSSQILVYWQVDDSAGILQTLWKLSKFGVNDKALLLVLHCETSERWMPMSVMSGVQAWVCQIFAFMEMGQIAQREKKPSWNDWDNNSREDLFNSNSQCD